MGICTVKRARCKFSSRKPWDKWIGGCSSAPGIWVLCPPGCVPTISHKGTQHKGGPQQGRHFQFCRVLEALLAYSLRRRYIDPSREEEETESAQWAEQKRSVNSPGTPLGWAPTQREEAEGGALTLLQGGGATVPSLKGAPERGSVERRPLGQHHSFCHSAPTAPRHGTRSKGGAQG